MGDNCQYQISNLFAWQCHIPSFAGLTASDAIEILGPQVDSIFSSSSDHLSQDRFPVSAGSGSGDD